MAETKQTDVVVLGGGPGGYAAAFLAADKGMNVTLVDSRERPGGVCLHCGCIPSKALLHAARLVIDAREAETWGIKFGKPQIDVEALRKQEVKIIDTMSKNLLELAKKRKVDYINARGTFESSTALKLDNGGRVEFKHCILATGSSPVKIPTLSIDSPKVMDSTSALKLDEVPEKLLVVGGGYIGLELGTVYAALGSKVTVVELTGGLLPGVDRDLVRPLQGRLEHLLDKIYLETKVAKLEETKSGIKVKLEGEEVEDKEPVFGRVLVSVGRRPNTRDLGLENTGVKLDEKGFVKVDEQRRSSDEHIFAIGDVAGEPMLAHKASHEGKVAVEAIAGEAAAFEPWAIPAVVFTDPEIAWCGLTETEAKRDKREVKVARFPWGASGRAMTLSRTEGLTKLIVDAETERVLGVGIVGAGAGELIAEGVLAVEMAATARDLSLVIHAHPTLSESIGEAADMIFGTATHLLRPKK
ncbi:MAG: dihydrolipoyl dehydrogenase [Gemmataceae bacterium]